MKNNLLLNNQLSDKLSQTQPLKKISNKLANEETCETKSKVINKDNVEEVFTKGFVNIGFVDQRTESSPWFHPYMTRDMAVQVIRNSPSGSFIVRNSKSHTAAQLCTQLKILTFVLIKNGTLSGQCLK